MHHTGLTMGGFTQPGVARGLIEHPPNVEKGLCQRFLWLAPQPTLAKFNDLQRVDKNFIAEIGMSCMCVMGGGGGGVRERERSKSFFDILCTIYHLLER